MPRIVEGTNRNIGAVTEGFRETFFEADLAGMRLLVFLRILP